MREALLKRAQTALRVLVVPCIFPPSQVSPALAADPPSAPVRGLKEFLLKKLHTPGEEDWKTWYSAAPVALHDMSENVLAYVTGDAYCGSGGCTALLLERDGPSFRIVNRFLIARLPVRVLASTSNGWHDISVGVGGGGMSHHRVILKYNGKKYPGNPSMAPVASAAAETGSQELPLVMRGDVLFEGREPSAEAAREADAFAASQNATQANSSPAAAAHVTPSFDCDMTSSRVEHLICDNTVLSKADAAMGNLYRQRLLEDPRGAAELRSQQRAFLKRRDQCVDVNCVQRAYDQRYEQLSSMQ
jgi:uncharacterized protein YecT (DUF1311 family)